MRIEEVGPVPTVEWYEDNWKNHEGSFVNEINQFWLSMFVEKEDGAELNEL